MIAFLDNSVGTLLNLTFMASHKGHNVLQQRVEKKSQRVAEMSQRVVVLTNQNTGFATSCLKMNS